MEYKVGDKVHYSPKKGPKENGIIKRIDDIPYVVPIIYVVYQCNNNWDNYKDYPAVWTRKEDLKLGWYKHEIEPDKP